MVAYTNSTVAMVKAARGAMKFWILGQFGWGPQHVGIGFDDVDERVGEDRKREKGGPLG